MTIVGLRFIERNQKRILQQKVVVGEGVYAGTGTHYVKTEWQDVPLEENEDNG